jgi:hypothetical protein
MSRSDAKRGSWVRLGGQIAAGKNKLIQIKSLAFACFYFTASGLFNDLRRIQIKKSNCQAGVSPKCQIWRLIDFGVVIFRDKEVGF